MQSVIIDTLLLAVAEPQPGKQRVCHLPVQAIVAQQAETRAGGIRTGKNWGHRSLV